MKQSVSIIIIFSLFLISNNAQGMITGPTIECSDISYDVEKNLSQISIELREKGWIITWSKYDVYISESRDEIRPDEQIQLPSTIGTLAYNEIHYLNCSNVVTIDLLNQDVWFKLVRKGNNREFISRRIGVVSSNIEHNFTIIDDYDTGRELEDWGGPNPDAFNLCASIYIIISFIFFMAVILIIIKNTRKTQQTKDRVYGMNNRMIIKNEKDLLYFALLTQIIILIPSIIIIALILNSTDIISLVSYPLSDPSFLPVIYFGSLGIGSIMSLFLFSFSFSAAYSLKYKEILVVIALVEMVLCGGTVLYYMVS